MTEPRIEEIDLDAPDVPVPPERSQPAKPAFFDAEDEPRPFAADLGYVDQQAESGPPRPEPPGPTA